MNTNNNNTPLAKRLVGVVTDGTWTRADFQQLDKKLLKKLAVYNGNATDLPESMREVIRTRGFTKVDQRMAQIVLNSAEGKSVIQISPETASMTLGGHTHFKPQVAKYVSPSGEKKERANSAIPAGFGETERYSNVVQLAALAAQLVNNVKGSWKSGILLESWSKTFKGTPLRVECLPMIVENLTTIMNEDDVWVKMTAVSRSAITGASKLCFVRQALDRLDQDSYDVLNTTIVCELFAVFSKEGDAWYRFEDEKGQPIVPNSIYEERTPTLTGQELLRGKYPGCFWYRGGFIVSPMMPFSSGDLESTLKSVTRLREVSGGADSATAILSGMRGFSGLTNDFGKRMQFQLATTIGLWSRGKAVDILLFSVGDIALLVSSLNYWKKYLTTNSIDGWFSTEMEGMNVKTTRPVCDFKFLLQGAFDAPNIPAVLRSYVVEAPRQDSIMVIYTEAQLPSAPEQGKRVDYDAASELIVPAFAHGKHFIAWTTIYGAIPFPSDMKVRGALATSTFQPKWYNNPLFVYQFSTAANFRGILSTIPALGLAGFGYPLLGGTAPGRNMNAETLHMIPLTHVLNQSAWYQQVRTDAASQAVAWMCPVSRYSPISNLTRVSKEAANLVRSNVKAEDGELIGNISAPKVKNVPRGKKIVAAWDAVKSSAPTELVQVVRVEKPSSSQITMSLSRQALTRMFPEGQPEVAPLSIDNDGVEEVDSDGDPMDTYGDVSLLDPEEISESRPNGDAAVAVQPENE